MTHWWELGPRDILLLTLGAVGGVIAGSLSGGLRKRWMKLDWRRNLWQQGGVDAWSWWVLDRVDDNTITMTNPGPFTVRNMRVHLSDQDPIRQGKGVQDLGQGGAYDANFLHLATGDFYQSIEITTVVRGRKRDARWWQFWYTPWEHHESIPVGTLDVGGEEGRLLRRVFIAACYAEGRTPSTRGHGYDIWQRIKSENGY